MVEDPGRQSISGSFQPIDVGEWSEQAYIGDVEKLFNAIAEGDKASVVALISGGAADLQKRDHVGRTPLQLAIIAEQMEIAELLVDEGARITARLVDGRTAFHLAAEAGFGGLLKKMLEASERNKREAEEKQKRKEEEEERRRAEEGKASKNDDDKEEDGVDPDDEDEEQGSSEDDWDSDGEVSNKKKKATKTDDPDEGPNAAPPDAEMPDEENLDEPDVIDINLPDWDLDFSPIHFAVSSVTSAPVLAFCLIQSLFYRLWPDHRSPSTSSSKQEPIFVVEQEDKATAGIGLPACSRFTRLPARYSPGVTLRLAVK